MSTLCERCGCPIEDGNAFCTRCGAGRGEPHEGAATERFCIKCGSPLTSATKFCTSCGAPVGNSAAPSGSTGVASSEAVLLAQDLKDTNPRSTSGIQSTVRTASPGRSPGGASKYLIIAFVAILMLVATIATGVVYVTHRVKQKVAEIKSTSVVSDNKTSKIAASNTTTKDPDLASVMKDLNNVEKAANPGTSSGEPAGPPDDPAKSMADAALVSQALLRNVDRPPSAIPASELPAGTGTISKPTPDSYVWTSGGAKYLWEKDLVKVTFPHGTSVYGPCQIIRAPADSAAQTAPSKATGNQDLDWKLQYERTEGGSEAALVVRTGNINNLGFGWPAGFDPFSGKSTLPHSFPWKPRLESATGTDRILLGSSFGAKDTGYDGYSRSASCSCPADWAPCENRLEAMPSPIELRVGALPSKINEVLVQMFVDDFQAQLFHSHFQVSLNGTRIPSFEYAINSLNQTGPIGKLVTLKLLPEYWPLLKSGEVKLLIDDPTTHVGDGYAVDFVRILINPHKSKYEVSLTVKVVDADQHTPIASATVTAALASASTDSAGKCHLTALPAGLVVTTATAPGFDEGSVPVDLVAGESGNAEIQLHRHHEDTAALEKELAQTGQATIYGIHFDTDSTKLRSDSMPALAAVLGLINNHPNSRWMIAGHTDNQGDAGRNQTLSEGRSSSVIAWLQGKGVEPSRLVPRGFGATRPVADNATANGRALNRRVEVALAK